MQLKRVQMRRARGLIMLLCGVLGSVFAAERTFPDPNWRAKPSPYASEFATRGGRLVMAAGSVPRSLNPMLDNNVFSSRVFGLMYESLLGFDAETGDDAPGLASRWSVSEDGRVFTFYMDPEARWSDGKPVTAYDVKWTFDAIMNPAHLTGPYKVALQTFTVTPPEVVSSNCVRFTAQEVHWRNLGAAGGFPILPSHIFQTHDFNKLNFEFPVVSGPYRLGEMKENVSLQMVRRTDWWAEQKPQHWHVYNFDTLEFRFFTDQENAWDAFRKGHFDLYPVYTARIWVQETQGERFDRHWIIQRAVKNQAPIGFQGFAMNLRRPPYHDVRVRRALAYLLDRKTLNETMMYGQYFLHRSYFEDLYDEANPCGNPELNYQPEKARQLLAEAGWKPDPQTGLLTKDGQPFVVRFLLNGGSSEKFLARYQRDLASVGIRLEMERKDWAAWARDMDAFNFDMTWAAWSSGLRKDPESMWSSAQARAEGGNNITGFEDPRVDALIEAQKSIFSVAQRHAICREIDARLAEAVPYILLWNTDKTRMLWWNKFGVPDSILSRYGSYDDALLYWWYDADAAEALADAMARGLSLPEP